MGADEAVVAEVVELLPNAAFKLRLENEAVVIAHAAGAAERRVEHLQRHVRRAAAAEQIGRAHV